MSSNADSGILFSEFLFSIKHISTKEYGLTKRIKVVVLIFKPLSFILIPGFNKTPSSVNA